LWKKLYKLYIHPITNYCHVDGIFQTFLAIVHHSSLQQTMAFNKFTLTKMSTLTIRMSILIKGMRHAKHMVLLVGFFTKVGANRIIIKKDYVFFPKTIFSYEWILEQLFLQLVIINAYSYPSTWHVFFFIIF
jgi:hypothetical protein